MFTRSNDCLFPNATQKITTIENLIWFLCVCYRTIKVVTKKCFFLIIYYYKSIEQLENSQRIVFCIKLDKHEDYHHITFRKKIKEIWLFLPLMVTRNNLVSYLCIQCTHSFSILQWCMIKHLFEILCLPLTTLSIYQIYYINYTFWYELGWCNS